jgi:D-aminopeptidase
MRCRFRELGFAIGSMPTGKWNAITDVAGVRVGQVTIREGNGPRALNTGLTMILPHEGDTWLERVPAAFSQLNGCGEVTGREGTFNVPRVADAMLTEVMARHPEIGRSDSYDHPFVAECSDAILSDLQARPIGLEHVRKAWADAKSGPVAEGCVGAGTGTTSFHFKAGIGTSSRIAAIESARYTVGVLVLVNTSVRELRRCRVGRRTAPSSL